MDTIIKQKWVEALRSGKYKQTTGVLKNGQAYCCLGVLCDVVSPEGWVGNKHEYGIIAINTVAAAKIGLTNDQMETAWRANDFARKTFEQIADMIEEEF